MTYGEVRHWCVNTLARLIYEHLSCSFDDRQLTDWLVAESYIDLNPGWINWFLDSSNRANIPLDQFNQTFGDQFYNGVYRKMVQDKEWRRENTAYRFEAIKDVESRRSA